MKCGAGVNPTAYQFQGLYRKLVLSGKNLHFYITGSNVILQDDTFSMVDFNLHVTTQSEEVLSDLVTTYEITELDILYFSYESSLDTSTCEYIAGFVLRKVGIKFNCEQCFHLLKVDETDCAGHNLLIKRKAYGKLVFPSKDCVRIIKSCEQILRVFSLKYDIFSTGMYIVNTN